MKIKNTKLSKRTLALLAATAVLFGGGSYAGTRAALGFFSNELTAGFELDHMQVHLIENDDDVCLGKNADPKERDKYRGNLVGYLGYTNDSHDSRVPAYTLGTPGKVEPGRKYREELQAQNSSDYDEYVRIIVHKYWVKAGKKSPVMDPALIKLMYNGNAAGNTGAWAVNSKEHTAESDTYYLKSKLGPNETSAPLFNELSIDRRVTDHAHMTTNTSETTDVDGNTVTVITYSYDYDDFTFYIEVDVQAIQTHNAPDAIKSMWGVNNVSAGNGKLTVN
ncbi:MAG: hypothetical protein IKG44_03695 [Mogibacterium sp.]|nr:hypothetical protein [Mogibacterium sp.]